jgi:chemotaxis protein methyltransferase CheR
VSCAATLSQTQRFRATIGQKIGLRFDDAKLAFLGEVLQRRLNDRGRDGESYLGELEYEPPNVELAALARELTVGETYFFRNNEQFRALAEVVLPDRMRARRAHRELRLLSAGCSSGEEPYSMAMVAHETIGDPSWKVSVRAVDLNPSALERAIRGRYSVWALRETPADIRAKRFREDGRDVTLDESIRAMVTFEQANLADENTSLWQPAAYDVVFCRNALMYFEPDQMRAVIERIARSLSPGGFLFLGHAETLRGVSDHFHLRNTNDTFYYQLKDSTEPAGEPIVQFVPGQARARMPLTRQDVAWFDEIRRASERVTALLPDPSAPEACQEPSLPFDTAPALDLLRQERFAEALHHVRQKARLPRKDIEALLLEAVLLVHCGQIEAADDVVSNLLRFNERNAAAHYIRALCREHEGAQGSAIDHNRAAADLDPTFAMPRLHLGLLMRRSGDRKIARREFAQALELFRREGDARILMFGGGFGRQALIDLCSSALRECGGRD